MGSATQGLVVLGCTKKKKMLNEQCSSMISASTPALASLHHELIETQKPNQSFLSKLLFGQDIHPGNRKQIRVDITEIGACLHYSGSLDPRKTQ